MGNLEKQAEMLLVCLLDGRHVSLVWGEFEIQTHSLHQQITRCVVTNCQMLANSALSRLGPPVRYSDINSIQQHVQLMLKLKFLWQASKYINNPLLQSWQLIWQKSSLTAVFQGIGMNYLDKIQHHLFLHLLWNIGNRENTVAIAWIIVF